MNTYFNEVPYNQDVNPTIFSHVPNDDQNFYKKLPFSQCTTVLNTSFNYCHECQSNLETEAALLYHKMFHISQRRNCNITDIITFCIRDNKKKIYCLLCDYIMYSEKCLARHLEDIGHQKRLNTLCYSSDAVYPNSTIYPNVSFPQNDAYNSPNLEFDRYIYSLECNTYYDTSQTTTHNNYINDKYGEYQILNTNDLQFQQNMQHNVDSLFYPAYFCFMCSLNFTDENQLFLHYYYDYIHKYKIEAINLVLKDKYMKFVTYANNVAIKCIKCQINWADLHGAFNHLFDVQHTFNDQIMNEQAPIHNSMIGNNYNVPNNMYTCPICKIEVLYDYMMAKHLESDDHNYEVQQYFTNLKCEALEVERRIFSCSHCNMNFFKDKMLLDHLYTYHQIGQKNTNQVYNSMMIANPSCSYSAPNNFYVNDAVNFNVQQYDSSSINYEYSVSPNKVNYNSVNISVDKNCQQKLIANTNDENKLTTLKNKTITLSSCTKKLINFSPRYVKMCVESGEENIFKVDSEKMKKLQLGISLTFPYESSRGCIPCGCEISSDPQLIYEHLRTEEHEKNLLELEENDEFFENYNDQFSDLKLAKYYIYEDSNESVKCLTCDNIVRNHDESIRSHISSSTHKNNYQIWKKSAEEIFELFKNMFENIWYYIEKFYCNICCTQFDFEVDFARHLENPKHLKEVEKRIVRKQNLQFDCCIMCSSYWYGKSDHHTIHCGRDSHKYILKSRDFTVPQMSKETKNLFNSVEDTINLLLSESDKNIFSKAKIEKEVLESTEKVARSKFPMAKAYLFGSRISYLSCPDSDLDIFLDCNNQYKKMSSISECQEELLVVQECFHKHQDIWIIKEIVLRTRVPIIKLRHRFSNLNCDISFINGLSVEKSKILG